MRKIFLLTCIFSFISPIYSEINQKKDYSKYSFYAKCLDDALPRKLNNALVWECSTKASKEIDSLIQKRVSSRDNCDEKGYDSHPCQLKRSQEAFKTYYQTECTWNKYGPHYEYCEMMLKKDRLKWLDKTLGT